MGTQLELKGDDSGDALRVYSAIFAISAVATPFAGLGIDKYGFPLAMLIVNTMLGVSYAVLIVPALEVQLVAYVLYSVGRVCLWAIMFSFVGAVFGFVHYGKLAGGALAFGAFLSLLQYAALELTLGPFEGNFTFVNTVWCALCASMYLASSSSTAGSQARAEPQAQRGTRLLVGVAAPRHGHTRLGAHTLQKQFPGRRAATCGDMTAVVPHLPGRSEIPPAVGGVVGAATGSVARSKTIPCAYLARRLKLRAVPDFQTH
eukprot:CAMPEP_0185209092 /NCGR_PEP_ID=MMETSP1140-20130426/63173_1 /TAXON_ID=298111 /ORGANISM="Pavlova sp., Strain CCMP459" /LENGTH=259 /DNA_ID=CAMNT_0027776841 /DNA_START=9 /DNA_END=787 /DNA_ORIENTATION=-